MTSPISPLCMLCSHYRGALVCEAFPDIIPTEIIHSRRLHIEPYPGDMGIRFDPMRRRGLGADKRRKFIESMIARVRTGKKVR